MGIELNTEQVYALYDLQDWWNKRDKQVFEISGAAGTGKTTLVRYLIDSIKLSLDEVLFVAFMGKAASQLSRHGLPAKTIHSAIYDYVQVPARDENGRLIILDNGKYKMIGKFKLKEKIGKKIKLIVIDEGSMVNQSTANDLLSFNIPVIVLGDLNQLPPVFGKPVFLQNPDIILKKIMRQAEGNPIIYLSQEVLKGNKIPYGNFQSTDGWVSRKIKRDDLSDYNFKTADIILTGTNRLRYNVNNFMREHLKQIKMLEYPHIGEKIICRKNNWGRMIDKGVFLTNGMTGVVDYISKDTKHKGTMELDFRPDFTDSVFQNIRFDYDHMYSIPDNEIPEKSNIYVDKFEFAYAITVHSSQGSQWDNVLFLNEKMMRDPYDQRRFEYTAITRASKTITIVE